MHELHVLFILLPIAECLSLPSVPEGTWYCKQCQSMFEREKFVEHNANAVAAGRVAGVDPIEQITNRCIRIVTTFEEKFGGCALCRLFLILVVMNQKNICSYCRTLTFGKTLW